MEKIDAFNEEEQSFGYELSQYPLRKQVYDKLSPYKKLYDNATNFLDKRDLWLKSKVGSHDPEEIETDVGQYYRNVYKLEKVFTDRPATHGLATTVSYTIFTLVQSHLDINLFVNREVCIINFMGGGGTKLQIRKQLGVLVC